MDKFNQSGPLSLPKVDFKEARKETPQFQFQALAFSLLFPLVLGIVGTVLGFLFWVLLLHLHVRLIWTFTVAGVAIGIYEIVENWDSLVFHVEVITGRDWNNDNFLGQPPQQVPHILVEAQKEDTSNSWILADLPGDSQTIAAWIEDACHRKSLAIELWEPRFGYTTTKYGTKLSIYSLFKKCLDDRGWLISRGSHGIVLSNEGRRILSGAVEQLLALPEGKNEDIE